MPELLSTERPSANFSQWPRVAQDRYAMISEAAREAYAMVSAASDRRSDGYRALERAQAEVTRLENAEAPAPKRFQHPGVNTQLERLADAQRELERTQKASNELSDRAERAERRYNEIRTLQDRLAKFIANEPGIPVIAKAKAVRHVEAAQTLVDDLRAEIHHVMSAPIPLKEVEETLRDYVAELAEVGRPDLTGTVSGGLIPRWSGVPSAQAWSQSNDPSQGAAKIMPVAIAAWLDPDGLLARLLDEAREIADDDVAIDKATRAKRITKLEAELIAAHRAEAETIIAKSDDFAFRDKTPPEAILGVQLTDE
ncbi:hypothetical protein SAMN05421853_11015 [Roseivivax halotolerans]|uniref:Uncharacterized protein n=1 Tax=Roseivivax halotolerans TaxID=93684 RepID=A0A1I5ZGX5_9RHOB|nr:hypothetical protein [Roseivivax halotolerans]SFQ55695.1 hypothetical protein SAMN05421853_11015 [Roseivivax halotolerans]